MRTTKCILSRLLSVVLILLLALMSVIPVLAVNASPNTENLKITIHNNKGLPKMTSNQFKVYQLFTGTPKQESGSGALDSPWDANNWNNYTLANVQWGLSVKNEGTATDNSSKLLGLLNNLTDSDNSWAYDTGKNVFSDVASAADVAEALVGRENEFMQHFSKFLMNSGCLTALELGSGNPVVVNATDPSDDTLTYTVPDTGYYLFAETGTHTLADATSEYIIAVLGNQDIDLKASIPTVKKWINNANETKGITADIGEEVTFVLQGTLPKNYKDFDSYKYTFHDTLSAGMSFDKDTAGLTVTVGTHTLEERQFTIETVNITDSPCNLEIIITDLKSLGFSDITSDTKITVNYKAKLDTDALIGSAGNENTVTLEYSNDPNNLATTATTNSDTVKVYTFGFDLKKVGSGDDADGLGDASFTLKNKDGTHYASFVDDGDKRRFNGWVAVATVDALIETYNNAKKAWDKASYDDQKNGSSAVSQGLKNAKDGLASYLLTSSSESATKGQIPDVTGLSADIYYLNEVITPEGYNTMDTFKIDVTAAITPNTGVLESFTYKANDAADGTTYTNPDVVFTSGLIPQTLTNIKAPLLPFTGGTGTLIFYILGTLLIAGAIIYLVIVSKKRNKS